MRNLLLVATAVTLATGTLACKDPGSGSNLRDIFTADEGDKDKGNDRRRPASNDEKLWTIDLSGCSGHLVGRQHVMTAAHCAPKAGASHKTASGAAFSIAKVVETDSGLDYAIVRVKWDAGSSPSGQRHAGKLATSATDLVVSADAGKGDAVFTVGYPQDKAAWGATYAEGQLKKVDGKNLLYNLGSINGNSGGGVWRKSDGMLVSLTNGGPHRFGQEGWNKNDVDDAKAWNYGAAIWEVYSKSAYLKKAYPSGRFSEDAEKELAAADPAEPTSSQGGGQVEPQPTPAPTDPEPTSLGDTPPRPLPSDPIYTPDGP